MMARASALLHTLAVLALLLHGAALAQAAPAISVRMFVSVDGGRTWLEGPTDFSPSCDTQLTCTYPSMLNTSGVVPRFRAMVTNNGDQALTSIRITHTLFPAWTFATFAKGATANRTYDTTWKPGVVVNVATATATSAVTNTAVRSQRQASFLGAVPSFQLPLHLAAGDESYAINNEVLNNSCVIFGFRVRNTGNVNFTSDDGSFAMDAIGPVHTLLRYNSTVIWNKTMNFDGDRGSYYKIPNWRPGFWVVSLTLTTVYKDDAGRTRTLVYTTGLNFTGVAPGVRIAKQAWDPVSRTWKDADDPGAPLVLPATSTFVTYRVTATNAGNVPLTVSVNDTARPAPSYLPPGVKEFVIPAGRTWTYDYNASVPTSKLTTIATLTSRYRDGSEESDWGLTRCNNTIDFLKANSVTVAPSGTSGNVPSTPALTCWPSKTTTKDLGFTFRAGSLLGARGGIDVTWTSQPMFGLQGWSNACRVKFNDSLAPSQTKGHVLGTNLTLPSAGVVSVLNRCREPLFCNTNYTIRGAASAYNSSGGVTILASSPSPPITCRLLACAATATNCVRSASTWATRSSWPVSGAVLGYIRYTKAELVSVLSQATSSSNALIGLAQQLAAAKLNVFYGANPPTTIQTALALGDLAVGNLRPPPLSGAGTLSGTLALPTGVTVSQLTSTLRQFNTAAVTSWPRKC